MEKNNTEWEEERYDGISRNFFTKEIQVSNEETITKIKCICENETNFDVFTYCYGVTLVCKKCNNKFEIYSG
jgi:hypothetical protein